MAVKVTSLKNWDIKKIIEDIGQPNIKTVIFFFSPSFEKHEPHLAISSNFPGAVCIGVSMHGGWSTQGAIAQGITVMSLSSDEIAETFISYHDGVKKNPANSARAAINELKQKTAKEKINPDEYLGLLFFDGLCLGEIITKEFSMESGFNMAFIGGAAADEMTFTRTIVSAGSWLSDDGLVAVILKMKIPFFFNHYVHYLPTTTSFVITRVEIMQRIAWEINGEPAAQFYAKRIGVDDVKKLTMADFAKNPLGLVLGDSIYIRSPNLIVNGTGIQFYCYIEAGTKVFLLRRGDIIAHAKNGLANVSQFLPGIQGCLLFNCVQRHLELIELDKIDEFNDVFKEYPMIGFNTYGEELFTHHNQTLTAVFFGTLPDAGMTDPYKTKRLFHYTDSKLKSLVFDIVSRSELLNITISYLKGSMDADTSDASSYETIKKSIGKMIEQSNISKEDIERMLIVYQNNVEKTGEYVFSIVDEISAQNRRLAELREEAEMASRTKTSFLASMSHEIRTPMNAITGMAELLLRTDLTNEARGYVQDIRQAGNNLISIINDILDFSKIEAGKMEIVPVRYLLASLINDTVNIIRPRIMEKPIRFYTNIDGKIPNGLIGDEVRIRQILLNLLSNAAKFTDKGHISISVTLADRARDQVLLKFTVTDTGKGIKEEDQVKLFSEFVQVDMARNRGVEGTGLGLAITRRLCSVMGGAITMESEYGKGSAFSVTIPQAVDTSEPFAIVENAVSKKVLVYEGRLVYASSVCWSLDNMGVPYKMVTNLEEFSDALFSEEWSLVLSGYGLYESIKKILEKPGAVFKGGKPPVLALMVEWGIEAYIPNVRFVSLPVQSLAIANVLNGKIDSKDYMENSNVIRHIFPNARFLVVDDIATNLKVSEGLLAPYEAALDTCLTGHEAIELVKRNNYDIIFMDHMMPEMDGIEATICIRQWEKESGRGKSIPIIALTANVFSDVREMFVENGFNDFLAKPIDVSKLDDILNRWIPKELRAGVKEYKTNGSVLNISGLDVDKGIKMTGGTEEGYRAVLSAYQKDAYDRLRLLKEALDKNKIPDFVIHVHAMKSASASIGADELSAAALKLETAGRAGDTVYIQENFLKFTERLEKMVENINAALDNDRNGNAAASGEDKKSGSFTELISLLRKLEAAIKQQNISEIDSLIDELSKKPLDAKTRVMLEKISDEVLMTEFEKAIKVFDELFQYHGE